MNVFLLEDKPVFRNFLFAVILIMGFATAAAASSGASETVQVKLYFADAGFMRLIPENTSVRKTDTEHEARAVINELIKGRDRNPKIRRLIPDIKNCMTVRTENNTAYVNITSKMAEVHPDGREAEKLTVYQIVNSLTSIEGIDCVRFTVNGSVQKNFMGYLDMREPFTADYFV